MRRTVMTAAAAIVLTVGALAPPAEAAANSYVVSGHPITAAPGMQLIGDECAAPGAAPTVTFLERDGGTVGASALGYRVNQAGSEAGPVVTLAGDPTTLSSAELDVLAPTGTTGHYYAYIPSGTGAWIGFRSLTVPANSWTRYDVADVAFYWYYYDGTWGTSTENPWTIQSWADGENATYVKAGMLLGCGGQDFYFDRLVAANAQNSATYDFEKKTTTPTPTPTPTPTCHAGHTMPGCPEDPGHLMAHMEWSTDGSTVQSGSSVTIRYGQSLWMLGHSHVHFADGSNQWYSGVGKLYQTPAKGAQALALSGAFSPTQYAALRVAPKTNTIYQFAVDAHAPHPATTSDPVTVWVQSKVKAKVLDKQLIQGQRLAVKGRILPATKRVKVALQRYVRGSWRSVASSHTQRGGWFDLDTKARDFGTWKVRVSVATTGANVGTTTKAAKVTVKKYVPPRKHQPPPPPQADPTPEVSTNVSTDAPTQVSTSAPKPPPRPTNTGRAAMVVAGGSTRGQAPTKP